MFPLKAFYWGQGGARENFALQIRNIVEAGYRNLGEIPIIIGESGIPMDMKSVFCILKRFSFSSGHLYSAKERHSSPMTFIGKCG